MSSQNICPPEPQKVILFGIRVFADVIKDLKMRSSWIRVGPTSNDMCPYKRHKRQKRRRHTETQGRRPCEDKGRDWNFAATSHGKTGATRSWRDRERLSPRGSRENVALLTF